MEDNDFFSKFAKQQEEFGKNKETINKWANLPGNQIGGTPKQGKLETKPPVNKNIQIGEGKTIDINTPGELTEYKDVVSNPKNAKAVVSGYNMPGQIKNYEARVETEKQDISPKQMGERYEFYNDDVQGTIDFYKSLGKNGMKEFKEDIADDRLLSYAIWDIMVDEDLDKNKFLELNDDEQLEKMSEYLYKAPKEIVKRIVDHYHDIIKHEYFGKKRRK